MPELKIDTAVNEFMLVQASYNSSRNSNINVRNAMFEGQHWLGVHEGDESPDETAFELTFNYVRNVVLRFAAILSRTPKARVPIPGTTKGNEAVRANRREKFLRALWPSLMDAWGDVELNASKYSYGVLQVLWDDDTEDEEPPFNFRSIDPRKFFPIYKTFGKPNDFLRVYRHDPGRYRYEVEATYDINFQNKAAIDLGDNSIQTEDVVDLLHVWTPDEYLLIAVSRHLKENSRREVEVIAVHTELKRDTNTYKRAPFWVLQNIRSNPDADPTNGGSLSDIDDIYKLNKHYNFILSEQAEDITINIHPPLIYSSRDHMQAPEDIRTKSDAVLPIGEDEDIHPITWQGEPAVVEDHLGSVLGAIKDLTFLGDAGFGQLQAGMTGLGFMIALTPLQQIIELKLPQRTRTLQSVCKFIFQCFERYSKSKSFRVWFKNQYDQFESTQLVKEDVEGRRFVSIDYGPLLPQDDFAQEQNEVYKYKTGAQSLLTTLSKIGFEDPYAELARIKEELQDKILHPESVMAIQQLGGVGQQPGMPPIQAPRNAMPGGMGGQMPMGMGQPGMEQMAGQPGQQPMPGQAPMPGQEEMGLGGRRMTQPSKPMPGAQSMGAAAGMLAPFMSRDQTPAAALTREE